MRHLLLAAPFAIVSACSSFSVDDPAGGGDAGADTGSIALEGGLASPDAGDDAGRIMLGGLGSGIAYHADRVYVTDATRGLVLEVDANGGAPGPFAETGGAPKNPLATADGLYWCDTKDLNRVDGPVVLFRSWDGNASAKIPLPMDQSCLGLAALPDEAVAYLHGGGPTGFLGYAQRRLGTRRSPPLTLDGNPYALASADSSVFVALSSSGTIVRYTGLESEPEPMRLDLATSQSDCQQIAANGTTVFWSRPEAQRVEFSPYPTSNLAGLDGEAGARSLVADGDYLYWRNDRGGIRRVQGRRGAVAEAFADDATGGFNAYWRTIALSNDRVFWLTADGVASRPKAVK